MAAKKISRNDPCPCGSGKKFKHCCIHKGIDWEARLAPPGLPVSRGTCEPAPLPPGFTSLVPFDRIDAQLKEIAKASPVPAEWKRLVDQLSDRTTDEERVRTYKAIRDAGVLPADAAFFLFGHAVQWIPPEGIASQEEDEDDEAGEADLERHTLTLLRRFGLNDITDLYAQDHLAFNRRYAQGRQFFFEPPDEALAVRLREMGIIE
jgi:hypothetical protein